MYVHEHLHRISKLKQQKGKEHFVASAGYRRTIVEVMKEFGSSTKATQSRYG